MRHVRSYADIPAQRFGDAQAVVDEQGEQRRGARPVRLCRREEPAEFVAVEAHGGRVVIDVGSAYPGHGGDIEQSGVPYGVVVEPGQTRETPGDRRRREGTAGAGLGDFGEVGDPGVDVVALDAEGWVPRWEHQACQARRSEK